MGRQSDAKERLMKAVLELAVNGSFGSLRIDDICQAADVRKGSFYYYFPSKEDLLVAALDWRWEHEWKPSLDRCFSPSLAPLERLRSFLETIVHYYSDLSKQSGRACGCGILSLASEVTLLDEDVAAATRQIFIRKRRYFESCIRDAVAEGEIPPGDAASRAAGLWALIEGALVQSRILNEIQPLLLLPQLAIAFLKSPMEFQAPTAESTR